MADVRRDVWSAGFKGMGYGAAGGYILHTVAKSIHNSLDDSVKRKMKALTFNRNTAFFSVMAGSALCSFLLATAKGKNQVHQMHDIFEVGKNDYRTPYQKKQETAKVNDEDSEISRERRRLSRRKTVSHRLTEGQGLSDSHSGTWVKETTMTEDERRRSARRLTMSKRLDESQGLSSSRG